MNFEDKLAVKTAETEKILESYLPEETGFAARLAEAMNYSMRAGGKRLRPLFLKEAYLLFGGEGKVCEPFMAAIEMIHTHSLIHDDLPAMDNDDYRRGKPTNHKVFGEAMAVLAGDALLTFAPQVITKYSKNLSSSVLIRVLNEYFQFAGAYGVIAGQVVDIVSEGKFLNLDKNNKKK